MENTKPRILAIDDEEDMLLLYKNILKREYQVTTASDGLEALKILNKEDFDVIIMDVIMPRLNGVETLKKVKEMDPTLDVIMATASKEVKPAIDSLKYGAFDYIIKPFEVEDLLATINKALERRSVIRENQYLKQALDERTSFGDLIGKSKKIREIYSMIENISGSNSTVLITGESGTGKEILANLIHKKSERSNKPYIVVNCAAIPENLLESEMFGHERGAFTGALERHMGKFELAHGGTIFLDEIGEMPLAMQAKLLRAVQEGIIERVGGEKSIPVDVRIIAATNIDIQKSIADKKFREDLFYRLNVIPISLPPLRERLEDVPLFVNYFVGKYNRDLNKKVKGFNEEALRALMAYSWPGNVRELENLIERMITLSRNDLIDVSQLPQDMFADRRQNDGEPILKHGNMLEEVRDFEKKMIANALKACNNNQTVTAKMLGIHRTTLISKMDAYGIKD